jgi:hypothetical protein
VIGRVYQTTSKEWVNIQKLYTLFFDKLVVLSLGKPKLVADVLSTDITYYYAPIRAFDDLTEQTTKLQQMFLLLLEDLTETKQLLNTTRSEVDNLKQKYSESSTLDSPAQETGKRKKQTTSPTTSKKAKK